MSVSYPHRQTCPIPELMDRKKYDIMEWTYKNPLLKRRIFSMPIKKGTMPPRYDEAFKTGAVKMVTEQGRPAKEVAAELGICIDTLKSWLKRLGFQPSSVARQNRDDSRR
ncbi:transposase, partial [Lachnospiraceae bacterium MD329]|nr:transposase [Lachnospiraceae bacterium MD329]